MSYEVNEKKKWMTKFLIEETITIGSKWTHFIYNTYIRNLLFCLNVVNIVGANLFILIAIYLHSLFVVLIIFRYQLHVCHIYYYFLRLIESHQESISHWI